MVPAELLERRPAFLEWLKKQIPRGWPDLERHASPLAKSGANIENTVWRVAPGGQPFQARIHPKFGARSRVHQILATIKTYLKPIVAVERAILRSSSA